MEQAAGKHCTEAEHENAESETGEIPGQTDEIGDDSCSHHTEGDDETGSLTPCLTVEHTGNGDECQGWKGARNSGLDKEKEFCPANLLHCKAHRQEAGNQHNEEKGLLQPHTVHKKARSHSDQHHAKARKSEDGIGILDRHPKLLYKVKREDEVETEHAAGGKDPEGTHYPECAFPEEISVKSPPAFSKAHVRGGQLEGYRAQERDTSHYNEDATPGEKRKEEKGDKGRAKDAERAGGFMDGDDFPPDGLLIVLGNHRDDGGQVDSQCEGEHKHNGIEDDERMYRRDNEEDAARGHQRGEDRSL